MMRSHWSQFIGLPHRTGADPCIDDAADCLLVAFAVLDELGLPHPPLQGGWFTMALQGRWAELREVFTVQTVPSDYGDGAVAMLDAGVAVAVGDGLLLATHSQGVRWIHLDRIKPLEWRRFR